MKSIVFCLSLLAFCISQQSALPQAKPVIISIEPVKDKIPDIFDHIKKIKIVALESSPDFIIGKFHPPIVSEKYIILYDTKTIFCFDNEGEFVSRISNIGKGPGEYLSITSTAINHAANEIEVLSQGNHKIFRYDIASGDYLGSVDLPTLTYDFCIYAGKHYFYFSRGLNEDWPIDGFDSHHQIYQADYLNGKIAKQFLSGSTRMFPWKPFNSVGGKLYVNVADSDTIYQFNNGRFDPCYIVNFTKQTSTAEYWNTPFGKRKSIKNYAHWLSTSISEEFLLINYRLIDGSPNNHFLFDRKTGSSVDFTLESTTILNVPLEYHSCYLHNNSLLIVVHAFELLDLDHKSFVYKELVRTKFEFNENSNPVLLFFELEI